MKEVETVWAAIYAHRLGIFLKNKGVGEKQCLPTDPTLSEMEPKLAVTQWEHSTPDLPDLIKPSYTPFI